MAVVIVEVDTLRGSTTKPWGEGLWLAPMGGVERAKVGGEIGRPGLGPPHKESTCPISLRISEMNLMELTGEEKLTSWPVELMISYTVQQHT